MVCPPRTTVTRPGRIFRAPRLDGLDEQGWTDLVDAGVRTIVDLRNPHEIEPLPLPAGVTRHHRPVEVWEDQDFMARWGGVLDSPEYYRANLETWPELVVEAVRAVAHAPDGAVVVHCSAGRDRTGLVTALLLSLVGVPQDAIVEDYACAVVAMNDYALAGLGDETGRTDDELAARLAEVTGHLRDAPGRPRRRRLPARERHVWRRARPRPRPTPRLRRRAGLRGGAS